MSTFTGSTFAGIREARIDSSGGLPRLALDGRRVPPLVYFHNTHLHNGSCTGDIGGTTIENYLRKEVAFARDSGVHLYSLPFGWPVGSNGQPDYATANGVLEEFIDVDPEALFILRIYPGSRDWGAITAAPDSEFARYADGSRGQISMASELFGEPLNDGVLRPFIRYYEASPHGKRIISYHPGAITSENFYDNFWNKGPDIGEANQRAFRQWLHAHYATEDALRRAWDQPSVSFATAAIPPAAPGRYPMRDDCDASGALTAIFYDQPAEQAWIDFSAFANDLMADRILRWARVIKEETAGRKLVTLFYGYLFELHGSFVGHYRLNRVLDCPDVDILVSPNSYFNRFGGGPMNFMSPVDSITAHGKLWLNEDDTRSSLLDLKALPDWAMAWESGACKTLEETVNGLDRNLGSILVHRAGTWWMDLVAAGAFNHPAVWDVLRRRKPFFEQLDRQPRPYRPEVAVIVDEQAKLHVKDDWGTNFWTLIHLRDACACSGAAVGYYTLRDFLEGPRVPPCKVYVFANAFVLNDAQVEAIRARLDAEQATAYWAYAPGYLGPEGIDLQRAARLTGMELADEPGPQGSSGLGPLEGESWGAASNRTQTPMASSPRLAVRTAEAEALGRYRGGGAISAARIRTGRHTSLFFGDMGITPAVLMRLFEQAGAHIWARDGSALLTDGTVLVVHSATAGIKQIHLPAHVKAAEPLDGDIERQTGNVLHVAFAASGTRWFRLQG